MTRDSRFEAAAMALGFPVDGEVRIGGRYAPTVRDGDLVYVSGQVPRIGEAIVVTGAAGSAVSLPQAQFAARICGLRALALLRHALGTLDAVVALPRISVYVQSAATFTQQSEVADAASDLFAEVLDVAGTHARTSVGVFQLPKNATVELDAIARGRPVAAR
jgi:enamine deaminase RidA (YjgF/YER057c/UK114 family)